MWTPDWSWLESAYSDYLNEGESLTAIFLREHDYQVYLHAASDTCKWENEYDITCDWIDRMLKHVS